MAKDKIKDLRDYLFTAMQNIQDPEKGEDLETAIKKGRAIADIGRVLIESAKVELEFVKEIGGQGTGFIPVDTPLQGKQKQLS